MRVRDVGRQLILQVFNPLEEHINLSILAGKFFAGSPELVSRYIFTPPIGIIIRIERVSAV